MHNSPHHKTHRIPRHLIALTTLNCSLLLFLQPQLGQAEIYKHVDAQGNVSFSDTPQGQTAKVVAIEADSNSGNVMETPQQSSSDTQAFLDRRQQKREAETTRAHALSIWRKELKAAQLELKLAKKAKSQGVVADEGDFIGSAGGGARPSPQYFQKLEDLDARVASAEKRLTTVRYAKPK